MGEVIGFDTESIYLIPNNTELNVIKYQVKELAPDVIIISGENSIKKYLKLTGILNHAGIECTFLHVPAIPIVDPTYLDHNPKYLPKLAEHLYHAYQIMLGIEVQEATNQHLIVTKVQEVMDLVDYCEQTGYCSFDFETTLLTDMATFDPDFDVTSLSISFQQGSSYFIPWHHKESTFSEHDLGKITKILNDRIFANPLITKVGHHIKFDMHCAYFVGVRSFRGPFHDTMIMRHLLDEDASSRLKDIVREYLPAFGNYESEVAKYKWDEIPLKAQARYNSLDSDLTLRLYWLFTEAMIEHEERLYIYYRNLVAPLTKVLWKMENNGMYVDKQFILNSINEVDQMLKELEVKMSQYPKFIRFIKTRAMVTLEQSIKDLSEKLEKANNASFKSPAAVKNNENRIKTYEDTIKSLEEGEPDYRGEIESFNFGSPAQVTALLFSEEGFRFKAPKDIKGNLMISSGKEVLNQITDKSGFIEDLQAYRQLSKIKTTYLQGILNKTTADHRIHGSFNQHITKTGRLSSSKPNLQNMISRTVNPMVEEAVKFTKQSFIVPKGYSLIQADYSQMELRLIALFANETNMLNAYNSGEDIHELTASGSRNFASLEEFKKLKETDKDKYKQYRYEAKAENFGFVYGASAPGFRQYAKVTYGIDMTVEEAERRRKNFFKKYPKLLEYHEIYKAKALKFGYVRTLLGRKVRLPDIKSFSGLKRGHAERGACNAPIQGTGGELMEFALVLLDLRLPDSVVICNTIHDSGMEYIRTEDIEVYLPVIKHTMEHLPIEMYFGKSLDGIPIIVDFEGSQKSWGDLEELRY